MSLSAAISHAAETTLFRELAKNKPRIVIVASGPEAQEISRTLQDAVLHESGNRHKVEDAPIVSINEAENLAAPNKKSATSFLWLLSRSEWDGKLPAQQSSFAPVKLSQMKPGDGVVACSLISKGDRGTAYAVIAIAPNASRLRELYGHLERDRAAKYDDLDFQANYRTYNLAVFSHPDDRAAVEKWGAEHGERIWSETRWYPLGEREKLAPEQLAGFNQAYFVDRSRGEAPPAAAAKLLEGAALRPTTTVVRTADLGQDCKAAVFSAPNGVILRARARRYQNLSAIPNGEVSEEVKDLRKVGRATIVVGGAGPAGDDREAIRSQIANAMRDRLKTPVEEPAAILTILSGDVSLTRLQPSGPDAAALRKDGRVGYVWHVALTQYTGATKYSTREKLLGEDKPDPFPDKEPEKPTYKSQGGGLKDEMIRRKPEFDEYERKHKKWLDDKADWERRTKERVRSSWDREVDRTQSAAVRGVLRLVNISDPEKPMDILWEKEFSAIEENGPDPIQHDTAVVRGQGQRPSSLTPPPNTDACSPELMRKTAIQAAMSGLWELQASAWLPDGSVPPDAAPAPKADAPPNKAEARPEPRQEEKPAEKPAEKQEEKPAGAAPSNAILVADRTGSVVTLNAGANRKLAVGDRAQVILKSRVIKDPATGETLKEIIEESVLLKITGVDDRTAEAEPLNAVEAAKLSRIAVGQTVKTWRPAPPQKRG